jgi:hypothetical protein
LDQNQSLDVIVCKEFVGFTVKNGGAKDFGTSVGIYGTYSSGTRLGRDDKTVIVDPVLFGIEWQVHGSEESQLYRTLEGPQYPQEQCKLPSKYELRLSEQSMKRKDAEAACAHLVTRQDFDDCVFDVLLTDGIEIAGAW